MAFLFRFISLSLSVLALLWHCTAFYCIVLPHTQYFKCGHVKSNIWIKTDSWKTVKCWRFKFIESHVNIRISRCFINSKWFAVFFSEAEKKVFYFESCTFSLIKYHQHNFTCSSIPPKAYLLPYDFFCACATLNFIHCLCMWVVYVHLLLFFFWLFGDEGALPVVQMTVWCFEGYFFFNW